jgi:hypothetical protein
VKSQILLCMRKKKLRVWFIVIWHLVDWSTGARTAYGKRRISFSVPTMFNSLGCNIELDMALRLSENLLRWIIWLKYLVWFGADSLSLYCSFKYWWACFFFFFCSFGDFSHDLHFFPLLIFFIIYFYWSERSPA